MNAAPPVPPVPVRAAPFAAEHDALAPGTRFGEFEIIRVLGVGGFGIVYLAMDHSLQREVALKEYMPAALAVRGAGPQITIRSGAFTETYAIGLRSFINEARMLAKFDHPSLVKVYRFWEDNATAYMVMPYLQGRTLRDTRRELPGAPDETWLRALLDPLLGAIEVLHREGVYHRDIAPDNILLLPDGHPVLLDFGAARRVISDRTQTLTAILKPSYAPIEQYADMTQLRQGPWTDVYALGAVLHFALLGAPPPPATARALEDESVPLAQRHFPGISQRFQLAIDWALAVRPADRPQSVEALRAALEGRMQVPAAVLQRAAMVRPGHPVAGNAYDTTLHLGAAGSLPTQPDTAHQPTMPMQPTQPMHPTMAMQRTLPMSAMAPTQPMLPTQPMMTAPAPMVAPLMPTARSGPNAAEAAAATVQTVPPGWQDPGASIATAAAESTSKRGLMIALAAVTLVLAGVVGWEFGVNRSPQIGPGKPVAPAVAVPSPAARAAVTATPNTAPLAAAPSALVPAPASAAAQVPTLVAPATPPPAAISAKQTAAKPAADSAAPGKPGAAAPARQAAADKPTGKPAPAAAERTPAPAYGATPRLAEPAPTPAAPAPEKPAAQLAVAAPVQVQAAAAPASAAAAPPDEPKTAREACGKRVLVALWQCMERECEKPKYRDDPRCVEALNTKRQRERN